MHPLTAAVISVMVAMLVVTYFGAKDTHLVVKYDFSDCVYTTDTNNRVWWSSEPRIHIEEKDCR